MPRPLPCRSGSSPVSNYYSQQQFSLSFIHCKIFHLHAHVYSTHICTHTHATLHTHTCTFTHLEFLQFRQRQNLKNGTVKSVILITGVTSCFCWVSSKTGHHSTLGQSQNVCTEMPFSDKEHLLGPGKLLCPFS